MAERNERKIRFKKGPSELAFFLALPKLGSLKFRVIEKGKEILISIQIWEISLALEPGKNEKNIGKLWKFKGGTDGEILGYSFDPNVEGMIDFSRVSKYGAGKGWIKIIG